MKDILEPKSFAYKFTPVEYILTQEQLLEIIKLLKELEYMDYRILKNTDDTSTFRFQCILHYNIFDEIAENKVRMIREKLYGVSSVKKKYIWRDVDWIEEVFLSIGFCSSYIVLKYENFLEMKNIGNALLNINYEPMYQNNGFVCVHIPCCNGYQIKAAKIEEYLFRSNITFCRVSDYDGFLHFNELRERNVSFKSNVGFREDLKLIMNSSWESNIARIFNYKNIPFEYEKHKFMLQEDKESKRSYIPDFFLSNNIIVEVKGFWDMDSLKKVSLFKEQYPEYDLKIIDQDMFRDLAHLYEKKVPEWEICETKTKIEKVYVVGVQRLERKKAVSELKESDEVHLVREPDNPYDKNAIAVYNKNNEQLGYIRRDFASVYAEKMDLGFIYKATIFKKDKSSLTVKLNRINLDKIIVYDFIQ